MDPAKLKNVLRDTLDDLTRADFKRFKHRLRDEGPPESAAINKRGIPWGKLEEADIDKTVDLMVQVYSSESGNIMLSVLQKMSQNRLFKDLEGELRKCGVRVREVANTTTTPDSEMVVDNPDRGGRGEAATNQGGGTKSSLQQKLRDQLSTKFSVVHQESGDYKVQEIYTDLYIVEGRTGGVETKHEVSALDMRQIQTGSTGEQIALGSMFKEKTKVLTLGIAGVGKTVAVQKFVMDWVEAKANHNIDFVFVLMFRELNLKDRKEKHFSLLSLIVEFYPSLKYLGKEILFESEGKVLFIFDGLDESRCKLDFEECINEPEKESSVAVLVSSVIAGQLLPSARIWVTTRPAAAHQIPRDYLNLVTEVRGFNDDQKIQFFQKNIKDQEKADRIIHHVNDSKSLHIMCHIPMFCHIIASVATEILKAQDKKEPPKTLTAIYTLYCVSQSSRMNEKYFQNKKMSAKERGKFLLKLGKLAFTHLLDGNLIFYERDMEKCNITVESGALQSGVFTEVFKAEHAIAGQSVFSFVHLSVQEFLAALYILHDGVHWPNPLLTTWKEKMRSIMPQSRFDLYKFAVEKALERENGEMDLFIRFLLGLAPMLEPVLKPPLDVVLPKLSTTRQSIEKTIQFVKAKINEDISPERTINLFHCLNELGDTSLVEEIKRYTNKGENEEKTLTPAQCSAVTYLLLMSAEELEEFDLKKYLGSEKGLARMLPVVKISKRVWLDQCHLSRASCDMMASMLQGTSSSLRQLDMSDNDLQDKGVELLCAWLMQPQCKLETLRLNACHLSKASCGMISSVLQGTPSSLRELSMSDNDLQDDGVELLSAGLTQPQCKLEILRLSGCQISHKGCSFLISAMKSNPSYLKEVDLSYNHPGDSGVRELTDRLSDPNNNLQTLRYDHGGECRMKPGHRKYACELTLDPNTANRHLSLSEGNRKVTCGVQQQQYPDHPDRFDYHDQVLCREGLTGRCYWEAEWSGGGSEIAVAYKSIQRKGGGDESVFGLNDKSWSLECSSNSYAALHNNMSIKIPAPSPRSSRVGVYLDWPAGTLSFYSVSSDTFTHLHTFHSTFTQPLCPGFSVWSSSTVSLCQIT